MPPSSPIHVAVNAHGLRSSQPLWLAMSIGKHRLGQPVRVSNIFRIHVRLVDAGLICGALSRVMNPISGRVGPSDLSLTRCRLAGDTDSHSPWTPMPKDRTAC